ncbi:MAG: 16S rRNA (adenine(1518)-N(6)/adenine(1519)-N(6))-dimethyltransferase RsmA [Bacteroidota bacterium]|nr:16S rRNA (adenine(1518)-N(6)/adenine(1519)-N(6))-dimethyltransferase RsmA [Bacteroidota bacterium]
MPYVKPKKSLGQHFLKDKNIAQKIVESLRAEGMKKVLEIGPGMGVLTQFLLERKEFETYLIEIDRESVVYLEEAFPALGEKLIYQDFLKFDFPEYFTEPLGIIGNFPYNISSQIFFRIIENKNLVKEVVCMIQKEVAERISSGEGNKQYGILSVLLQAFYDIDYLFTVGEQVFSPPPKVKSAVIRLVRNQVKKLPCDEALFLRVVKTGFNQRRKTLRNSLRIIIDDPLFEPEILKKRPEQLSVAQFIYLTSAIENQLSA